MTLATLKSPAAFAVTGADRDRYNEAVHWGHVKHAPEVVAGAPRQFPPPHLTSLFCFHRQLAMGDPPRRAGEIASQLVEALIRAGEKKSRKSPAEICIAFGLHGACDVLNGGALHPDALVCGEPLYMQMVFSVANIEALLEERTAALANLELPEVEPPRRKRPRRRWGEE